ncbi:hypothetical protein GCM10010185_23710 [Saccharothrix coeruleofusca]|uniref:Uncharacterized protein n=1 Tax=Saccharothrix coeruleofusca TaxID=33919 RepID=A0A918AKJ5_9PSEU|nr:hypothetical protein GCM10010185_23710 [Saccharothrix coeruleofusca]
MAEWVWSTRDGLGEGPGDVLGEGEPVLPLCGVGEPPPLCGLGCPIGPPRCSPRGARPGEVGSGVLRGGGVSVSGPPGVLPGPDLPLGVWSASGVRPVRGGPLVSGAAGVVAEVVVLPLPGRSAEDGVEPGASRSPGELPDGELLDGELLDGELLDGVLLDGVLLDGVLLDGVLLVGPLSEPLGEPLSEPPREPEGVSMSARPVCRNPPCLTLLGLSTSRPVALPASLPTTFMTFSKTSTRRLSSGETFLMVLSRSWMSLAILVAHFEIAVTAWATITGVPNPRVNTASSTQAISLPTRSAIRSRTISRTNPTTMPISPTTVPTDPAAEAAPASASPCTLELAAYCSAAAPVHPSVPDLTAAA